MECYPRRDPVKMVIFRPRDCFTKMILIINCNIAWKTDAK